VVPATAGDGLVLEVPPSDNGWPTPIAPAQTAQTLRFAKDAPAADGSGEVTVRFLAMPIR
jgi:hypothetical protein